MLKRLYIIQLTRTNHHISYLSKCEHLKAILKSLQVNFTSQVLVINSTLQLKWEEAHLNFGCSLTKILLEYWKSHRLNIFMEITSISDIIKLSTGEAEILVMNEIIQHITLSVKRELSKI